MCIYSWIRGLCLCELDVNNGVLLDWAVRLGNLATKVSKCSWVDTVYACMYCAVIWKENHSYVTTDTSKQCRPLYRSGITLKTTDSVITCVPGHCKSTRKVLMLQTVAIYQLWCDILQSEGVELISSTILAVLFSYLEQVLCTLPHVFCEHWCVEAFAFIL